MTGTARHDNEERTFRLAIERSSDTVFITALDGTITYVNPAFEKLYGFTAAEAIGKTPRILKSGAQDAAFYEQLWAGLLAKQVVPVVVINKAKDGKLVHVEATANPILDEHNDIIGFLAIQRDVTARKLLEEQFRQAQKMEAIGRLAGGVAHDFNNLLSVILSYASTTIENLPPGEMREHIEEIQTAGMRAAELTGQLLAFSRRQVLHPRVVDLNESIAKIERMLGRLLGEDVELRIAFAPSLATVKVDPGQLEQVVMNLAVNARDAMPNGGTLTIEVSNVDHADDSTPGPHVALTITDTGTGIDDHTMARIFEPFYTTKEVGKGTGLGLATVLGIVEQSNGTIRVRSEPGRGTTFTLLFPRSTEAAGPAKRHSSSLHVPHASETILVVEDDEQVRDVIQWTLRRSGYEVLVAAKADDALLRGASHGGKIHLLLTDVVMLGDSGRQLADRLVASRPDTKVLFMSGYVGRVSPGYGIPEGASFLPKPITQSALLSKVREVLDD